MGMGLSLAQIITFQNKIMISQRVTASTYNENDAIEAVREAIKQGINYIDTGFWYGQGRAEALLGKVPIFLYIIL